MNHKEYLEEFNRKDSSLRNVDGMIHVIMIIMSIIILIVGFAFSIFFLLYVNQDPSAIILLLISLLASIGLAILLHFIYRLIHKYALHQEYLIEHVKKMGRIVAYKRYNENIAEIKRDRSIQIINIILISLLGFTTILFIYTLSQELMYMSKPTMGKYIDIASIIVAYIGEVLSISGGIIFFRGKLIDEEAIIDINRILIAKNNQKLDYKDNRRANITIISFIAIGLSLLFIGVSLPLFKLDEISSDIFITALGQTISNIFIVIMAIVLVLVLIFNYIRLDNKLKRELKYIINDLSLAPNVLYLELGDNKDNDLVS